MRACAGNAGGGSPAGAGSLAVQSRGGGDHFKTLARNRRVDVSDLNKIQGGTPDGLPSDRVKKRVTGCHDTRPQGSTAGP